MAQKSRTSIIGDDGQGLMMTIIT